MNTGEWGLSLKSPYACDLTSCKQPPRLDILGDRLQEV